MKSLHKKTISKIKYSPPYHLGNNLFQMEGEISSKSKRTLNIEICSYQLEEVAE